MMIGFHFIPFPYIKYSTNCLSTQPFRLVQRYLYLLLGNSRGDSLVDTGIVNLKKYQILY